MTSGDVPELHCRLAWLKVLKTAIGTLSGWEILPRCYCSGAPEAAKHVVQGNPYSSFLSQARGLADHRDFPKKSLAPKSVYSSMLSLALR